MKFPKSLILGFLVMGLSLLPLSAAFAQEGHDDTAFIKTLQASASALQTSHPSLASDLTDFANEEANEKEGKETPEEKNTPQRQARRAAHLQLLRDSAAALQTSNPDLAAQLTKRADRNAKRMAEKK